MTYPHIRCNLCHDKVTENGEVMVNFSKVNDRMLTRSFVVCEKCACGLLQKFIEAEPNNKRCNNG